MSETAPAPLANTTAAHSLLTFHYEQLASQQNMLEDAVRTGAYHQAITGNPTDFQGKVVLDVGAGSGILSLFAAQAGARRVFAVEATSAAEHARELVRHAGLSDRVQVIHSRLADVDLPEHVDVIVSEPLGVFLLHERMLETFVEARQRWLKAGGRIFPSRARMWLAPFSDAQFYDARLAKIGFWREPSFFGVDLSPLLAAATREHLAMVAVGPVDAGILMASPAVREIDFSTATAQDLADLSLPFCFGAAHAGVVHGLCGWFDASFLGSDREVLLSTAPDAPLTHWYQVRLLFAEPLSMRVGQTLRGELRLTANEHASYSMTLRMDLEGGQPISAQSYELQYQIYWWHNGVAADATSSA